jgi:hypothetical protein
MHYVLNTRGYIFHKEDIAKFFRLFLGNGILSLDGPLKYLIKAP